MRKISLLVDNKAITAELAGDDVKVDIPDTAIINTIISKKLLEDGSICDVATTEVDIDTGIQSLVGISVANYDKDEYQNFIEAVELIANLNKLKSQPIQSDLPIMNAYEKIVELLNGRVKILDTEE